MQIPEKDRLLADGLTVRVINNINRKLEVKPKFLETFRNEGYPEQFPYKQKVSTCEAASKSVIRQMSSIWRGQT